MLLLVILIIGTIALYIICRRIAFRNYIPQEEIMQKLAQPDKYRPWSIEKRRMYFDREVSSRMSQIPSRRPYIYHGETGYIHKNRLG